MNRKARLFQIANFTNFFSIVIFLAVVIYRTKLYLKPTYSSDDIIAYGVLSFIFLIYLVNFYFGLKIAACFYKEAAYFKFKSTLRIVFFVLEIITFLAYTLLLAFLIPSMSFSYYGIATFDNAMRIIGLLSLFLGYSSSLMRLILTRPLIKAISLKNKHIFDDLGSDAQ